jgi:hypothetical protein
MIPVPRLSSSFPLLLLLLLSHCCTPVTYHTYHATAHARTPSHSLLAPVCLFVHGPRIRTPALNFIIHRMQAARKLLYTTIPITILRSLCPSQPVRIPLLLGSDAYPRPLSSARMSIPLTPPLSFSLCLLNVSISPDTSSLVAYWHLLVWYLGICSLCVYSVWLLPAAFQCGVLLPVGIVLIGLWPMTNRTAFDKDDGVVKLVSAADATDAGATPARRVQGRRVGAVVQ